MTEQVHLRQNENCGTMIMALREKFLSAVATLTKVEQNKLWKELENDGTIKPENSDRV